MKKSFVLLVTLATTLFAGLAHADARGDGAKEFYALIETYRKICVTECHAPFKNQTVFDIQEPAQTKIPAKVKATLQKVSDNQAQIWGDTILEGDYHSDGQTQLDAVVDLYENNKLIGYKITYSEKAWYTGDCDFDEEDESTLKECTPGRIQESTYVSPDFKTYFRDEDDFADFQE